MKYLSMSLAARCSLAALCLSAPLVQADHSQGFYLGGGAYYAEGEALAGPTATRDELGLPALEFSAGYKYNSLLGVEIRYGMGTDEKFLSATGAVNSLEYVIDSSQSIYYRAELSNHEAKLYFLLGHTELDATETLVADDTETAMSYSGLSYGLGVGWFVDKNWNINIEYRALIDDDEAELTATNVSIDYRFKGKGLKFW